MNKLSIVNHTQKISSPTKDCSSGIFRLSVNKCKIKAFKKFRKLVESETKNSKINPTANSRDFINAYFESKENRKERYGFAYGKTLFCDDNLKFNLSKLGNPIDVIHMNIESQGVNGTMLLIAGALTSFPWHDEDLSLASINYLHWGADKIWIIIHRKSTCIFRQAIIDDFAQYEKIRCSNPLKHKNYLTNLKWLDAHKIKYSIVSSLNVRFLTLSI